jgi:hypothetical protein
MSPPTVVNNIRIALTTLFVLSYVAGWPQQFVDDQPYTFGSTTYKELEIKTYEPDTSAAALILQEFGHSTIESSNNNNLLYTYYVKIKILKTSGLDKADISIMLRKSDSREELLRNVKASSFTEENGPMVETKLSQKNVFSEPYDKYWNVKKFAIPNVRVGSIIEYEYQVETPFFYSNFKPWDFQSEVPKISSEYWATIPANYQYNMALIGLLKLSKQESEILEDYFQPGSHKADAVRYKWAMKNVPAFVEEEYMTARRNFLSAISFELMEVQYFNGRRDKVTKDWKDAEQELRQSEYFGLQIKRGKDIVDDHVANAISGEIDPLEKTKKIYEFIRGWYRWNEYYGKYSDLGIRKAFEKKEGNVGDINLSLIAALKYGGLEVEPVILATRDKGLPKELFPVLTDFNYVVAKVNVAGKFYLLDATDDFVPFGVLPERCLNGKGRVLGEKESSWLGINAIERGRRIHQISLTLEEDGRLHGEINTTYSGYSAANARRKIYSFTTPELYIKDRSNQLTSLDISNFSYENLESFSRPLVEKMEVEVEQLDLTQSVLTFNPMILERWQNNPFKSTDRLFPVDFIFPFEEIVIMSLSLPVSFEIVDPPSKMAIALPNGGGRFVYDVQLQGNKIQFTSSLLIGKSIYLSNEYLTLKEFFARLVSKQGNDLVIRKRAAGD